MAVTIEDLHNFHLFAGEKLAAGAVQSFQDLVDEWNSRHTRQQSVANIRESIAQYDAGEGVSADEAFDEVRTKLGWDA